jgi:hypothetical protein
LKLNWTRDELPINDRVHISTIHTKLRNLECFKSPELFLNNNLYNVYCVPNHTF